MKKLFDKYKNMPVQLKASIWFLICSFLQKGISMLTTPIFTRLLTTEEYGQFNVFNSWLGIVTVFVSLSLTGGVFMQGLIKYDEDKKVFASSIQGLSTALVLAWIVIYLVAHHFWNNLFDLTTVQMLAMLIMIWTTSIFNFWSAEQRTEYKYKALVIITLIVSLAKPIIGIVFVLYADDKVTARILGILLVELIGYFGLYVAQMRRGKVFYSKKYWKYAIMFNLPLIPHYLSQIVLSSSDRIMISNIVGDSQTGIYSLAYSLSSIMLLFNTALMQTLNPWIYQKIKNKEIKDISKIAYVSLAIIAFVNLMLILVAPEAVAIFAPSTYKEAIYVIPPVAMSVYFIYCYDLFAKFAFYYEKTKLVMLTSIIGAILNIILNYIFINQFGYMAAGYTTLVCYIIYSFAHYILMNNVCKKHCDGKKPYNGNVILALTLVFIALGFLFLITYDYPIIRYSLILMILILLIINNKKIKNIVNSITTIKSK